MVFALRRSLLTRVVPPADDDPFEGMFVMVVQTDNPGSSASNQFEIPTTGGGYNYSTKMQALSGGAIAETSGNTGDVTLTAPGAAGTYRVGISGTFPRVYFNSTGDELKILSVESWGDGIGFGSDQTNAFRGCANLTSLAEGFDAAVPVVNGTSMFNGAGLTVLPSDMALPLLTNGTSMFVVNSLTSLPSVMNLVSLVNGSNMFAFNNLTALPVGMTLDLLTNGASMFRSNSIAALPSGMTLPILVDGDSMFAFCNISTLPSGMTLPALTDGVSMFLRNSLTSLPVGMALSILVDGRNMFSTNSLTAVPAAMVLSALTDGTTMFFGNTIGTTSYSDLLVRIEANNANTGVTFDGGNSEYNATGEVARNALLARSPAWVITDGGLA